MMVRRYGRSLVAAAWLAGFALLLGHEGARAQAPGAGGGAARGGLAKVLVQGLIVEPARMDLDWTVGGRRVILARRQAAAAAASRIYVVPAGQGRLAAQLQALTRPRGARAYATGRDLEVLRLEGDRAYCIYVAGTVKRPQISIRDVTRLLASGVGEDGICQVVEPAELPEPPANP